MGKLEAAAFLDRMGSEPLAARMRPAALDEFVGQEEVVGPGKLLRRAIEADQLSSIILWGPPGSGKTTLAHVIARRTQSAFLSINAVLAGVKEIRESIEIAQGHWRDARRRTILFVDEVHRFNKAQQDALLPHVENGTIILVGATTENPYFEVIKPLVSRSRIFALTKLEREHIAEIIRRALADRERGYGARRVRIADDALAHLSDVAQGDARSALNALELAVETTAPDAEGWIVVDRAVAEESIQRRALLYDKDGDAHYDAVSAFIKSLRGSDPDAALYWMARMLRSGEDPRFIARRMVILASEDVGMADPQALAVATAAAQAVEYVGMPECQFNLAQACIYLATAEKSNSAMAYFDALKAVEEEGADEVPDHLKDPSRDRRGLGHGKGYRYPHAYRDHWVAQQYLPDELAGRYFYHPSDQGFEATVRERLARLRQAQGHGRRRAPEETAAARARPWDAYLAASRGRDVVRQRDCLFRQVRLRETMAVLDAGPDATLGWSALGEVPLGRVVCLLADAVQSAELSAKRREFRVDRILLAVRANGGTLPFRDASFDCVLARRPIGRAADPAAALAEVARVLRPGGTFVFAEPLPARRRRLWQEIDLGNLSEDLAGRVIAAEESLYRSPETAYSLDEELASRLLSGAGLTLGSLDLQQEEEDIVLSPSFMKRLFDPAPAGGPASYGDRLRRMLSPEEYALAHDVIAGQLAGRTIRRQIVVAYGTAARRT